MRIAICISQSAVGGVGTSTYILAQGMRQAGHQADILVTEWWPGPDYERARGEGWPVQAISAGQRWLRRRLEVTRHRLSSYDVVINNHSTETRLVLPALPAGTLRLSAIRSTNEPVILEAKQQSRYLDALVAISPEVQRLLNAANVECPTTMIPNAVMVARGGKPALARPLELAYLGRLTDVDKNILVLPKIALACRELGMEFSLSVAGDGCDRRRLEATISDCGLTNCIRVIGAISRDAVGEFLGKRHFGIFPSNYEGFGLALVESMAVGCVPVASDIPSHHWIVGADAKMLLVPGKDPKAYAQQICTLAGDPERYRRIQVRLQKRQRDNFTPRATVNGYLALIDELRSRRDPERFAAVPFQDLELPRYYKRRCTWIWRSLQICRQGFAYARSYRRVKGEATGLPSSRPM